jgi:hypothetical protein
MTTTTEKIAELKRMLAEATPGPWCFDGDDIRATAAPSRSDDKPFYIAARIETGSAEMTSAQFANCRLAAAAVDALPALLDDLEAAQRRLDHEAVMATRYANEAGALEGQLDDARKREQVLRHELTRLRDVVSAVEYDAIDAALADTEVKP